MEQFHLFGPDTRVVLTFPVTFASALFYNSKKYWMQWISLLQTETASSASAPDKQLTRKVAQSVQQVSFGSIRFEQINAKQSYQYYILCISNVIFSLMY
jgi:hypothetical protein